MVKGKRDHSNVEIRFILIRKRRLSSDMIGACAFLSWMVGVDVAELLEREKGLKTRTEAMERLGPGGVKEKYLYAEGNSCVA